MSNLALPSGLDKRAFDLRLMMINTLYRGGRGHLPSALSCIDIIRVLYDEILNIRPSEPQWAKRDRFILSKGHGCIALYTMLAEKGFFPITDLDTFCAFNSHLGGHPERGLTPGVEATTGSLGHGPSIAVGMACAMRLDNSSARVFVLTGDGELNEGSIWEACLSAAKNKLNNLIILVDYNKQQSWDDVDAIIPLESLADKFHAFGMAVAEVDGHNLAEIHDAVQRVPFKTGKPSVLICHTIKGKGIASLERNLAWHHKTRLTEDEYNVLCKELQSAQEVLV